MLYMLCMLKNREYSVHIFFGAFRLAFDLVLAGFWLLSGGLVGLTLVRESPQTVRPRFNHQTLTDARLLRDLRRPLRSSEITARKTAFDFLASHSNHGRLRSTDG